MDENKRIVEVNGVKLEIDLREARTVDSYKIGDSVKLLLKESYSTTYRSYPATIVGFDQFQNLPTIIVAYLSQDYSSSDIKFVYINNQSKDVEICPAQHDVAPFEKTQVIDKFNAEIEKKTNEMQDLINKKKFFENNFNKYFNK